MHGKPVRTPSTTYLVRVWDGDGAGPTMRGEVEQVATGERKYFDSYWSLIDQIETWRKRTEAVS